MAVDPDVLNRPLPETPQRPLFLKALRLEAPIQIDRVTSSPVLLLASAKKLLADEEFSRHALGLVAYAAPGIAAAASAVAAVAFTANQAINYPNYALDVEETLMALGFVIFAPADLVDELNRSVSGGLAGFIEARIIRLFSVRIKALEELSRSGETGLTERLQTYRDGLAEAQLLYTQIEEHLGKLNRARSDTLAELSSKQKEDRRLLETRYNAGLISEEEYTQLRNELRGDGFKLTIHKFAHMTNVNEPEEIAELTLFDYYSAITLPPPVDHSYDRQSSGRAVKLIAGFLLFVLLGYFFLSLNR